MSTLPPQGQAMSERFMNDSDNRHNKVKIKRVNIFSLVL